MEQQPHHRQQLLQQPPPLESADLLLIDLDLPPTTCDAGGQSNRAEGQRLFNGSSKTLLNGRRPDKENCCGNSGDPWRPLFSGGEGDTLSKLAGSADCGDGIGVDEDGQQYGKGNWVRNSGLFFLHKIENKLDLSF